MLQFAPMQSFVDSNFWYKLDEIKVDQDRLSDAPKTIYGFYTNHNSIGCLLQVDYSAFNSNFKTPKLCFPALGTLYNKNTIEDFKQCDKQELLAVEGNKLLEDFKSDRILDDPSLLVRFFILSFADIKCHTFYYWFAFPCPLTPTLDVLESGQILQDSVHLSSFTNCLQNLSKECKSIYVLNAAAPNEVFELKTILSMKDIDVSETYFCFADPNSSIEPSWIMRTYAAFIFYKRPDLIGQPINFLGVRLQTAVAFGKSMFWRVVQKESQNFDNKAELKFVGWERNRNNRMGPRVVNMQEHMDPAVIAENSVNLNLKLMKWRLVPDLNLEAMKITKCLLFGAGTLGCAVARNLLSWGFKHVSFIDNGHVGYSNPIRQSLYIYDDAKSGKVHKATTAAKRLKEINPSVITNGHVMKIPMPGHTIGESMLNQTIADLTLIEELIKSHDAIFLLTDSRESRWLPTLLGATHNKIVINAALGFDSYLVQRHGGSIDLHTSVDTNFTENTGNLKCVDGKDLGCYFCNDIIAPGNSQKDRTLDQQCTVTRPGVSNIAASYAVELLVSLLQHPLKQNAPAYYCHSEHDSGTARIPEGKLGIIPHSIRGNLYDFQNILPATSKFEQCIACSKRVLDEFKNMHQSFLLKVFETSKFLEDLTGISAYKDLDSAVIDYDDAELEMSEESE